MLADTLEARAPTRTHTVTPKSGGSTLGRRARAIRPKWGSLVGEDAYALVVLDAREPWDLVLSRVGRHMVLERR